MAIDFPASPTLNDVFTVGNVTYVWDGTKWTASVTGGISLDKIEEGNTSAEVIDTGSDGRFVVTTEGTERLRVTDTGRVGIGTTSPNGNTNYGSLDLNGSAGGEIFFSSGGVSRGNIFNYSATPANLGIAATDASGQIIFNTGGYTERLRITSAGNVGVGTSSPSAPLHVARSGGGVGLQVQNTSTYSQIEITSGGTDSNAYFTFSPTGTGKGIIQIGGSDKIAIDSSGRVGIGVTAPADTLHVRGPVSGTILNLDRAGSYSWKLGQSSGSDLTFTGDINERVRFTADGKVLVGTSSGSYSTTVKLQGNSASSTGESRIRLCRGAATPANGDTLAILGFSDNTETPSAEIAAQRDGGTWSGSSVPGRLTFSTTADGASSPTERMRIRSDGNIGFFNISGLYPNSDNAALLGFSAFRWSAVWAANGTIQTSDQRAKAEITGASLGADFIKALRPVSYKWIEGGKVDSGKRDEDGNFIYESVPGKRTHWGFIAQEVKQAVDDAGVDFGGWVLTDKDDPDSQQALRYDQFIAPLTKALQEAMERIETLEGMVAVNNITIDEQQHQLSTLAARLTALENA
jgi:hypothetical protein